MKTIIIRTKNNQSIQTFKCESLTMVHMNKQKKPCLKLYKVNGTKQDRIFLLNDIDSISIR